MSVKVSYKGSQIATIGPQQTKTLLTAGKYCEDDFVLVDDTLPEAPLNDVIFIDYDGTIRYSYSADEFLALTELPPNPHHAGLVAQGWNWTLTDAQEYVEECGELVVGQNYITTDGKTHLHLAIESPVTLTITLSFQQSSSNGVTIDPNNGDDPYTVSGTGNVSSNITYVGPGAFDLTLYPADGCTLGLGHNSGNANIIGNPYNAKLYSGVYGSLLRHVRIGRNAQITNYAFYRSYRLSDITVPEELTNIPNNSIAECRTLQAVICGKRLTIFGAWCGNNNYSLRYMSFNRAIQTFTSYGLYGAYDMAKISLPMATTIQANALLDCRSLSRITIPSSVTAIKNSAIAGIAGMCECLFAPTTPATVENINAFSGWPSTCLILVPYTALAAYLAATNYPDPATYTYLGFATYADGATLPTQDGTEAYSVIWYASKADAVAGTSPIATGNGKEIYCTYTEVSA